MRGMVRLARLLPCLALFAFAAPAVAAADAMRFWDSPRRGANLFDRVESGARLRAAAAAGIGWVRVAPDKWAGAGRDFLIGDADSFTAVPAADLARLRGMLDRADSSGVKVALVMLSLPGARWRQHNGDRSDFRLYREERALAAAERFWGEVATALRGHPALVAYDLLNEPHPERARGVAPGRLAEVQVRLLAAVRAADPDVPVILEGGAFAAPEGIDAMAVPDDPRVLYSFHFYEPWAYVNHRQGGRWRYPGDLPADDDTTRRERWDVARLEAALAPVVAWQARHGVPSSRVICAEFGVPRTHPGAAAWLRDVVRACERHGWHWAFYAFREDTWPAMDYELGDGPLPRGYWAAAEAGRAPELPRRANALWDVVRRALAGDTTDVAPAGGKR